MGGTSFSNPTQFQTTSYNSVNNKNLTFVSCYLKLKYVNLIFLKPMQSNEITIKTEFSCPKCHQHTLCMVKRITNGKTIKIHCPNCSFVEYAITERECYSCFRKFKTTTDTKHRYCEKCRSK